MDSKKDYKDRLPNKQEIKNSLDRYFGFLHAKINSLGSLDFEKISKMQSKGWHMQSSKEEIEGLIDDFVNIYGYIYKEGQTSYIGRLVRGTTTDEVEKIKRSNKIEEIISTTTEEHIAKRFCEYGKAALVRIQTGNTVPYLYVEHIKDGNLDNEEEVLVLPFTKVKKIQLTSEWQEYKYYDISLEKEELPELSEEKIEELKQECIVGYDDFINQQKEYENLKGSRYSDEEKMRAMKEKINAYKSQFQQMLKGMCRQREKDIDLQRDEENRAIEEEKRKREEDRIKRLKEEIQGFEERITHSSTNINETTKVNVSRLVGIVDKYRNISNTLGIKTFNSQNLEYDVNSRKEDITEQLQKEVIEQDDNIRYGILLEMIQKHDNAQGLLQEMPELLKSYDENSMQDLKINLNKKVQDIIYRTASYRLNYEKQMQISQKDNLVSKLLGKTALKEAKIRNLEAKINYAGKIRETQNPSNSVRKMLYQMYECAYKYNGGNLTQEMIETEQSIRKVFSNLPDQNNLIEDALNTQLIGLPATTGKRGLFSWMKNGQEAKRLNGETLAINQEMQGMNISSNQMSDTNKTLTNLYSRFNNILENTRQLVSVKDRQQEIQLDKEELEQ